MLFTSAQIVLFFLPLTLAGFFGGGWMPMFTWLLRASICSNFYVGLRIAHGLQLRPLRARAWLMLGVCFSLGLLACFKEAMSTFMRDSFYIALGGHRHGSVRRQPACG